MLLVDKRQPTMQSLRPNATPPCVFRPLQCATSSAADLLAAAAALAPATTTTAAGTSGATRKRKIIVDEVREKRLRTYTELEYEEMLAEAALLREELELLVAVAADLCQDLAFDAGAVRRFSAALQQIEELFASREAVTVQQIRETCQRMLAMMQYLCRFHFEHFALIDMQDQLRACRNRFMLFICQNAAMLGL